MRDIQPFDSQSHPLATFFRERGTEMKFQTGATIAAQGSTSDTVYRILRGCVRVCAYSECGERRILQFLSSGDYFGIEDVDECITAREAVDTVVLSAVSRKAFEAEMQHRAEFQNAVRRRLAQDVGAHASLFILTAKSSAVERVKLFLEDYARRRSSDGFIALPMCRRDIADHLGLSMETVSRSFSTLREGGEIALRGANFFRPISRAPVGGLNHAA